MSNSQSMPDTIIVVNPFVHVSRQQGAICAAQRGSLSDLKVGQTVDVWSRGIMLTSYPGVLLDVTDVVILE